MVVVWLLLGCHPTEPKTTLVTPPAWDPEYVAAACPIAEAPLLDAALADADIARDDVGYSTAEYAAGSYASVLDDAFLLPWVRTLQADAFELPCFSGDQARALDAYSALGDPVTGAMRTSMTLLGEPIPAAPLDPAAVGGFDEGMNRLLAATGDTDLAVDASTVSDELQTSLGPILYAMAYVVEVWENLEDAAPEQEDTLAQYGHGGVMVDYDSAPDLTDPDVQAWVVGHKARGRCTDRRFGSCTRSRPRI